MNRTVRFRAWRARLVFAAWLGFGSEIVLWTDTARPLLEWAAILPVYIALAAILLELAAFYRSRGVFEAMALMGIYGIANALLINPATALVDVPRTLVTRALGGHALIGLAMLALFLYLWHVGSRSGGRALALFAAVSGMTVIVGLAWGTWARWTPVDLAGRAETPLMVMQIAAALVLAGIAVLCVRGLTPPPAERREGVSFPRLTRGEGLLCALILAAAGVVRLAQGAIDGFSAIAMPLLILYCLGVLYFRQRKTGGSFLNLPPLDPNRQEPREVPLRVTYRLVLIGVLFVAAGNAGYAIMRTPEVVGTASDWVTITAVIFTGYGLVWLPCVSLVLGGRAFIRNAGGFRL
jgi:hypothetical protein